MTMCNEITDGCEDCERLTGLVAALTAERDALARRVAVLEADVAGFRAMERARWERAVRAFGPGVGPTYLPPVEMLDPSRPIREDRP
jgi:hypothetical protein